MGRFQDLEVWQLAKDLAKKVYELTGPKKFNYDYSYIDQIRKATISISSNIAEGEESGYIKTCLKHFRISKGSNAEVQSQAIVANEIGFLNVNEMNEIIEISSEISKKLFFLIKYRESLLE